MLLLTITALVAAAAGILAWLFALHRLGRLPPGVARTSSRHLLGHRPPAVAVVSADVEPVATAGVALTFELAVLGAGVAGFGILLFMVRGNVGFARFDLSAAQFGARHATALSTRVLRLFTQLGGAVLLVPMTIGIALLEGRRHRRVIPLVGFLILAVGGQFLLVDIVKSIVDRARPNIDRLTGFSGPSFPSGHAAAAAACFAAFALVLGRGRSTRAKAGLCAGAIAVAAGIATTRVFLGVHWLTDVLAGLAVGWAWFALCTIAFARRGLRIDPAPQPMVASGDPMVASGGP